jgi:hypothetical protein
MALVERCRAQVLLVYVGGEVSAWDVFWGRSNAGSKALLRISESTLNVIT